MHVDTVDAITVDEAFASLGIAERNQVVRLCGRLSGAPDAAEDLAQEVFVEAWRSRARLRNPALITHWLAGIARNVCRRWHRRRAASRAELYSLTIDDVELADDIDLEIALERREIGELLDRALHLLPSGSRELLVERYVDDRSLVDIASRHGVTPGAAAVRLHRGASALREVVRTELRAEAVELGITDTVPDRWTTTRIWCPYCGEARLRVRREIASGTFVVRCLHCGHRVEEHGARYLGEVTGYWRTLLRVNREADRYFRDALASEWIACARCGHACRLRHALPPEAAPEGRPGRGVSVACPSCGTVSFQPDTGLVLTLPAVQRFWRSQSRIRYAGRHDLTHQNRNAMCTRFEAVGGHAAISVLSAVDTCEVLAVEEGS
jgi:RNA polymerase sigma factor (sigma-70 family)